MLTFQKRKLNTRAKGVAGGGGAVAERARGPGFDPQPWEKQHPETNLNSVENSIENNRSKLSQKEVIYQ